MDNLVRIGIIAVLILHGIGHIMGFLESWTSIPAGFTDAPWILSNAVTIESTVGRVWGIIWLVAGAAFVVAGVGLINHQDWWRTLVIAAAFISLIAIVPWFNTVPAGAKFGAVLVDLVVIFGLLPPWGEQVMRSIG